MPSKTSLLNKELLVQTLRSGGWISLIYFLGLFFTIPVRLIMEYANEERTLYFHKVDSLFQYDFNIQIVLILILPIGLAVFLFRYLHSKQASDLMHSIPLKREKIFHHYALAGVIFLVVPVILTALSILILHSALGLGVIFTKMNILTWAGVIIIFNLLLFVAGVFVAMMTGMSIVHAVLTYIFLLFPVGMMVLLFQNFKNLFYGFPANYYMNRDLEKMSPLTYVTALESRPFLWKEAVLYCIITIILYVLALFFYKKRRSEAASEAISFRKLRVVFKYGVTFCSMLAGGMYYGLVPYSSFGWIVFGYVIGAVLGYYIAEMVLRKTWRVFGKIKGLVLYGAVMTIIITGAKTIGYYENYVPQSSEVKNVLFSDNPFVYMYPSEIYGLNFIPQPVSEKKNIEAVTEMHKQIIKDKNVYRSFNENLYYQTAFFVYELNNGDRVIREYQVNRDLYTEMIKPIYESEEYKRKTKEIFKVKEQQVESIKVSANGNLQKVAHIFEPEEVKEAFAAIQADELEESYEDSLYFQNRGSSIEISLGKDRFIHLEFKPTYLRFTSWLKAHDLLDQARVNSKDLARVVVKKGEFSSDVDSAAFIDEIENSSDVLEIKDKGQIDEALNMAGWNSVNREYAVVFYYKSGNFKEVLFFDENHVPEFIRTHFK